MITSSSPIDNLRKWHVDNDSTGSERNSLSGEPDYFGRNKISSGGDLSHYSSASLY